MVSRCGLDNSATWSHMQATGTRFLISVSFYTMTSASMELLQHYVTGDHTMVRASGSKSYKLTSSPLTVTHADVANKNMCMILRGDGSFKIQGLPQGVARVCEGFRSGLSAISRCVSWSAFLISLEPASGEAALAFALRRQHLTAHDWERWEGMGVDNLRELL